MFGKVGHGGRSNTDVIIRHFDHNRPMRLFRFSTG